MNQRIVDREVRPRAWWRMSTLPECRPCVTTDAEEAQEWRDEGHDVRELAEPPGGNDLLAWACGRWREEVQDRPLVNRNRRALDDTWRQVVRYAGGNPDELLGPAHDVLLAP